MPTKAPPPEFRDPVTARVLPNWRVWRADDVALLSDLFVGPSCNHNPCLSATHTLETTGKHVFYCRFV